MKCEHRPVYIFASRNSLTCQADAEAENDAADDEHADGDGACTGGHIG